MPEYIIAGALTLVPVALYHLWIVRRHRRQVADLIARLAETRAAGLAAYADGYAHGQAHTNEVRDAEAESIRRQAYNRGKADATRTHVRAA